MQALETKLGYTFRRPALLENALYHSSYANEHRCCGVSSNERLEFLGTPCWAWSRRTICTTSTRICRRGPDPDAGGPGVRGEPVRGGPEPGAGQ